MKTGHTLILASMILILAACAPPPRPVPDATPITPPVPTPGATTPPGQEVSPLPQAEPGPAARPGESPLPQPGLSPISPLPAPPTPALTAAVTYLAGELGVPLEAVTAISFEPVEWPDASLGCPQPGMMYAQVVTPGYRILLEVDGVQYEIHTDQAGGSVVTCDPGLGGLSDPGGAFRALRAHLARTAPGFGLDQQAEWAQQDVTKAATVGISTWAWRSGAWTVEMTFPAVPEPAYESVLFHRQAGTLWRGTLEPGGQVTPLHKPPDLSFDVGPCDETIAPGALQDWAGVEIAARGSVIHVDQRLPYVCCAELALSAGRDGDVIRVIETNVGDICRCMCGYAVTIELTGLPPGTYTIEIWGIQHQNLHPLQLLSTTQTTLP